MIKAKFNKDYAVGCNVQRHQRHFHGWATSDAGTSYCYDRHQIHHKRATDSQKIIQELNSNSHNSTLTWGTTAEPLPANTQSSHDTNKPLTGYPCTRTGPSNQTNRAALSKDVPLCLLLLSQLLHAYCQVATSLHQRPANQEQSQQGIQQNHQILSNDGVNIPAKAGESTRHIQCTSEVLHATADANSLNAVLCIAITKALLPLLPTQHNHLCQTTPLFTA
jgi:hypothetical protein